MLSVCLCVIASSVRVSNAFILLHSTRKNTCSKHLDMSDILHRGDTTGHIISIFSTINWFLSFTEYLRVRFVMSALPSVIGQPNRPACHFVEKMLLCLAIWERHSLLFSGEPNFRCLTYSLFILSYVLYKLSNIQL